MKRTQVKSTKTKAEEPTANTSRASDNEVADVEEVPSSETLADEKRIQFLWDWANHEDTISLNRGNFFLVCESMMVAAYATLIASSVTQAQKQVTPVCILGLAVSLLWLIVNVLHMEKTEKPIMRKLREFKLQNWIDIEAKRFKYIRIHYITAYVFPLIFAIAWILFIFRYTL